MNSNNNTTHFGNPLVTGIVGGNGNGNSNSKHYNNNNNSSLKSPSTPRSTIHSHQQSSVESPRSAIHQHPNIVSPTFSRFFSPSSTKKTRIVVSESLQLESRQEDSYNQNNHRKSFSHGSASSSSSRSSIGLPSIYTASHQHHRNNSFESNLLEELQDFDEIFGS